MDYRKAATFVPRLFIRLYQIAWAGSARRCRFYPSCSHYMLGTLEARGLVRGLGLGILRIAKCHPWHPGGFDPANKI